jgi:serine/threonine-protein kinase
LLGEGGFGAVYLAQQVALKREVVVKVIRPTLAQSTQVVDRFEREALLAARLTHPNTVVCHDFGRDGDLLYLVMEYLEGATLAQALAECGRFDTRRSIHIATQICGSLEEAHALGMVHRDLKPQNILLVNRFGDSDFVKVIDFGLAKIVLGDPETSGPDLTQQGEILGTPAYMAPEQVRGGPLDNRCDLYALGALLFIMLTGRRPFEADTPVELAVKHLSASIPSAHALEPSISLALDDVIRRCLAKMPEDRPQTAGALSAELRQALDGLPPGAKGPAGARIGDTVTGEPLQPFEAKTLTSRPLGGEQPVDERGSQPQQKQRRAFRRFVLASAVLGACGLVAALVWPGIASEPSQTPTQQRPEPDSAPAFETIRLSLFTDPAGAEVLLDGEAMCRTPCEAEIQARSAPGTLRIVRAGFEPIEVPVSLDADLSRSFSLTPLSVAVEETPPEPQTATPPEPQAATPPEPQTATPPEPQAATPPEPQAATPPEPQAATPPPESTETPSRRRRDRERRNRSSDEEETAVPFEF